METNIDNVNVNLASHMIDQRQDFDKVFTKIDNLRDNFAGKWVEKVLIGILITVIAGIVITLL